MFCLAIFICLFSFDFIDWDEFVSFIVKLFCFFCVFIFCFFYRLRFSWVLLFSIDDVELSRSTAFFSYAMKNLSYFIWAFFISDSYGIIKVCTSSSFSIFLIALSLLKFLFFYINLIYCFVSSGFFEKLSKEFKEACTLVFALALAITTSFKSFE